MGKLKTFIRNDVAHKINFSFIASIYTACWLLIIQFVEKRIYRNRPFEQFFSFDFVNLTPKYLQNYLSLSCTIHASSSWLHMEHNQWSKRFGITLSRLLCDDAIALTIAHTFLVAHSQTLALRASMSECKVHSPHYKHNICFHINRLWHAKCGMVLFELLIDRLLSTSITEISDELSWFLKCE